jgi:hypothetical protein
LLTLSEYIPWWAFEAGLCRPLHELWRAQQTDPAVGHLKSDLRLSRNYLKGVAGDHINPLLAATAWNLRQWVTGLFCHDFFVAGFDGR